MIEKPKELTLVRALKECARIWAGLAKSGTKKKPLEDRIKYSFGCPACEYVTQKAFNQIELTQGMACCNGGEKGSPRYAIARELLDLCPMKQAWPNGCLCPTSPYAKWEYSNNTSAARKRYARQIANAARRILNQHLKKK